jgi:hypothetical protein
MIGLAVFSQLHRLEAYHIRQTEGAGGIRQEASL